MLREVFTLCILGLNFAIGVAVCGVFITPLLNRFFRHLDAHPRWYD